MRCPVITYTCTPNCGTYCNHHINNGPHHHHYHRREFLDLPAFVSVLESCRPRAVVAEFRVQSSSPVPAVHILSVTPPLDVFENPIVNPPNATGISNVQIVLNGSLDFEQASLVSVRLGLVTASGYVEQTLHVRVVDANEPPQCEPLFQVAGAEVHVPENLPLSTVLYTVLASDPDRNDSLSFSVTQVFPASDSSQFDVDKGGILTTSKIFDYHNGPKEFVVSVMVKDRQGANCTGTVRFKVLRVNNPPLDFILSPQNVSVFENQGPENVVASVRANTSSPDVIYTFVRDYPPFKIGREDGVIRTAYNLDLEAERALTLGVLLVRATSLAQGRSGTATLTVNVLDVNEYPPFCSPSVFVLEVPETIEVGRNLGTLTCVDIDVSNHNVTLSLVQSTLAFWKFRLKDGQLQVNNTLDYDVAAIASNNFQYEATILATDTGSPPMTSKVRVLVTVTPVNEFEPVFQAPFELPVREDTRPGTAVGVLQATDADWPFSNIRYSLLTGQRLLSLDPVGGQLYLNTELDFEAVESHRVTVQAEDYEQDVDKTNRKKRSMDIFIRVVNVNDNAPVCNPVAYESTIFSTQSQQLPILSFECSDLDNDFLTATITNGAAVDRFQLTGFNLFSRNVFSFVVDGVYDRTMFEVTVSVSDGRHQTQAVAYIFVVPWTTTTPATTTTTTTKAPLVVTVVSQYWDPDPWFIALLTVTGGLLILTLSLITWAILKREEKEAPDPRESQRCSSTNSESSLEGTLSLSKVSLQDDPMRFDGKAQDPVSGRCYLFNSTTGERRWL
ncbi:cadherin-related family member 4-like [Aplochiton taeniatus]